MENHNQNQDKRPEIDLNRFRKHQRNIPWGLIRKIIIGLALVGLMWYFIQQKEAAESIENNKQENEVEVDVEL